MARGRPSDPLVAKTVELLHEEFTVPEMVQLLQVPKKTLYDLIEDAGRRVGSDPGRLFPRDETPYLESYCPAFGLCLIESLNPSSFFG